MKETIIAKLQEIVGLSEEQAKQAADVVMKLIEEKGGDITKKLGGMAGGLGGMFGGGGDDK